MVRPWLYRPYPFVLPCIILHSCIVCFYFLLHAHYARTSSPQTCQFVCLIFWSFIFTMLLRNLKKKNKRPPKKKINNNKYKAKSWICHC